MDLLHKTLSLSDAALKFAASDSGRAEDAWTFSGFASKFNGIDSYGDTILPGAYSRALKAIRAGDAPMPKMFLNHRMWDLPLGKWLRLAESDEGLKVDGELTKGLPLAAEVRAAMQHETIDGLSVGIRLSQDDFEVIDKGDGTRPQRVIKSVSELVEVSVVTFPADRQARIDSTSIKSIISTFNSISDYEAYLRDVCGFSKSAATLFANGLRRQPSSTRSESGEEGKAKLPDNLVRLILENHSRAAALVPTRKD